MLKGTQSWVGQNPPFLGLKGSWVGIIHRVLDKKYVENTVLPHVNNCCTLFVNFTKTQYRFNTDKPLKKVLPSQGGALNVHSHDFLKIE